MIYWGHIYTGVYWGHAYIRIYWGHTDIVIYWDIHTLGYTGDMNTWR